MSIVDAGDTRTNNAVKQAVVTAALPICKAASLGDSVTTASRRPQACDGAFNAER